MRTGSGENAGEVSREVSADFAQVAREVTWARLWDGVMNLGS